MAIDLTGKTFCCFGLRGEGKSTLVNSILQQYGKHGLIYDTVAEAPDQSPYDIYQPKDRYSVVELETIIRTVIPPQNSTILPYYRLFVVDEANRFCPSKPAPLPPLVADLNDQCRHYQMAVGYVARRPVQLNQDLTELADYLFVFMLKGKNDIAYLDNIAQGLGDAVRTLRSHEFVMVNKNRTFVICEPVTPEKLWLDRADRLLGIET